MNHPTNEEWMSYLYNEAEEMERARLTGHLKGCTQCRARVTAWQGAQRNLDEWRLEPRGTARKATVLARPWLKWAAAVVLFAGIGFSAGRFWAARPVDAQKLRAEIEPEIRQQLRAELVQTMREELEKSTAATLAASREQTRGMLADYAQKIENARVYDNAVISAALERLDTQQTDDYVSLKKQLDTVAVNTDASLQRTQNQMVELAGMNSPNSTPSAIRHNAN